jgi:DNA/RNA-binding domain of Phe-tRNA-synthetase-like protein
LFFSHHPQVWSRFPELVAGALSADGIGAGVDVQAHVDRFLVIARRRLADAGTEAELPEIQAWRRAFAKMGLKPTQYRCASESLLRRFRKEDVMPRIHPLIDLCNAVSMAYAVPVAALDVAQIDQWLQVRPAAGTEDYQTFGGEIEHPEPGEVSFVDAAGRAHARRWTNRQSGLSAVRDGTRRVLIVTEALHATAAEDVPKLCSDLAGSMAEVWGTQPAHAILSSDAPGFTF